LATRNPEFDYTDEMSAPSRSSPPSVASDLSRHEINTAAAAASEKTEPTKRWQTHARRRLWGIVPYWAIYLTFMVFVLMGIILGPVIGSLLANRNHGMPPSLGDS
jgi:hypothetical protein